MLKIFYFEHVREPPNLVLPVFERSEPFKNCYERAVFWARTEVRTTLLRTESATMLHGDCHYVTM